ncbi:hypothetical protein Tco_0444885 [Tanacetum coccineum]
MLRDLWDPKLLGLDREMHYHLLFMKLRCLRFVYRFRKRPRRTTPGPGFPEDGEVRPLDARFLVMAQQSRFAELQADRVGDTDDDFGSAESRPSETETVSGGTKDSEEPQDSDDRALVDLQRTRSKDLLLAGRYQRRQ